MQELEFSELFVAPLAVQISEWLEAGKLGEDDLDRRLTSNARSIVDAPSESVDWVPLRDVESLMSIVAEQLGSGGGVVDWAEKVALGWNAGSRLDSILANGRSLVDGAGYVITQSCELLIRGVDWQFEGGRERFSVWIFGLEAASPNLSTLLGAILARVTEKVDTGFSDLHFDGMDAGELCVFGARQSDATPDESGGSGESRLHRAALVG